MSQYPAVIHVTALDGSNGFRIDGGTAFAHVGFGVALADVNNDGFSDILTTSPTVGTIGMGYVVFGSDSGFAAAINVSQLNGSNGFAFSGTSTARVGETIASAGDLNSDGFEDFVLTNRTASYVVLGGDPAPAAGLASTDLDGTNGFRIDDGEAASGIGDINSDGFGDLAVADGVAGAGVIFGKASGFSASFALSTLDGSNGFQLTGATGKTVAVACADDFNGDGLTDMVIGAYSSSVAGFRSGEIYVVFGRNTSFGASLDVSSLDGTTGVRITGANTYDLAGFSVDSAGDVNGDGFADLVIGAPGASPNGQQSGAAYVVFGSATFAADFSLSELDGSNGFKLNGEFIVDSVGWTVASAGDMNGDGFDDVLVGAHYGDGDVSNTGTAYVIFGKASGFDAIIAPSSLDGSNGFIISGKANGDSTGSSVAGAGDANGDGLDDVVIGAHGADWSANLAGTTYVVFGRLPDAAVNRVGTDASQKLVGGSFDDILSGLDGNDELFGNGGADAIKGDAGDDVARGGDGADRLNGGNGDDELHGGDGNDVLVAGKDDDQLFGDDGDDTFQLANRFRSTDSVDGGTGYDKLVLAGDYSFGLRVTPTMLSKVEEISVKEGFSYDLRLDDANIAAGQVLRVDGRKLTAGNSLAVDASRETDGALNLFGGADADRLTAGNGADFLKGGDGNDVLRGGLGIDQLLGGGGADSFAYTAVAESSGTSVDQVKDLDLDSDRFDLWFTVDGIDATHNIGPGEPLGQVFNAANLGVHHAAIAIAPTHSFLVIDANGIAGYQAGADLLIRIDGYTGTLDTGDFV